MKLQIKHTTSYAYDAPVTYALQQVRLTPTDNPLQEIINWDISIKGGKEELHYIDQHKNHTLLVSVEPGQSEIHVIAQGEVETLDTTGILGNVYGTVPLWHFRQNTDRTKPGPGITKLSKLISKGDDQLDSLHALSKEIIKAVPYGMAETSAETTAEEALDACGGVCQDHAQIFISAVRKAGIPARYVSGYLMMDDRIDQDASHAWAEAHLDDLGWVGFDVSNGISPDDRYVRIATGLDSREAAPISGMRLGTAAESMIVSLQIQQ